VQGQEEEWVPQEDLDLEEECRSQVLEYESTDHTIRRGRGEVSAMTDHDWLVMPLLKIVTGIEGFVLATVFMENTQILYFGMIVWVVCTAWGCYDLPKYARSCP
jgi:hypothetical protein